MDLWLPGYPRDGRFSGAGNTPQAGRPKVVLHTTESPTGSAPGIINSWVGNWGRGLSHFIGDDNGITQLLPLNVASYTLENRTSWPSPNKAGYVVQIEYCGYAANGLTDAGYERLGRWLADLRNAGLDFDPTHMANFAPPTAGWASYSSPRRMDYAAYRDFNGVCGHCHVYGNAHWDPGAIDAARLANTARRYLGAQPTGDWFDMATKEELAEVVTNVINAKLLQDLPSDGDVLRIVTEVLARQSVIATREGKGTYECQGMFMRCLTPEMVTTRKWLGVRDVGVLPENFFASLTEIPTFRIAGQ